MMRIDNRLILAAGIAVILAAGDVLGLSAAQREVSVTGEQILQRSRNFQEMRSSCHAELQAVRKYVPHADSSVNDHLVLLETEAELQQYRERAAQGRAGTTPPAFADANWAQAICGIEVRRRQLIRDAAAEAARPPAAAPLTAEQRTLQIRQEREKKRAQWIDEIRKGCAVEYAALPASMDPDRIVSTIAGTDSREGLVGYLKRDARESSASSGLWACAERVRLSEWGPLPPDLATPLPPNATPPAGRAAPAPAATTSGAFGATINPIDSKTKPGTHERRSLCEGYLGSAPSRESERAAMAACVAQPILTIRDIKVLPPEMAWENGDRCAKAIAVKTEAIGVQIETTVQVRNNCKGVQHVHVVLKEPGNPTFSTGIWFGSEAGTPWPPWPPYNEFPKLGYIPTVGGQNWHIVSVGETIRTTIRQLPISASDIPHKIGACDAWTADRKRRKSFQDNWFTRFDCFEIPPAEPSAEQRQWERMKKDPTPIGPRPKKKAPAAPKPAAKTPPKR